MSYNDGNMYETNQHQQRENISQPHSTNFPNQGVRNDNNEFFPSCYPQYANDISAVN